MKMMTVMMMMVGTPSFRSFFLYTRQIIVEIGTWLWISASYSAYGIRDKL